MARIHKSTALALAQCLEYIALSIAQNIGGTK